MTNRTKPRAPEPAMVAAAEREAVRADGGRYSYPEAAAAAREARDRLNEIIRERGDA